MKKLLFIALLLNCRMLATAQEQLSKKQTADKLFERYEYFKALNLYLPPADRNNPDVRVIERIADCYRLMNDGKNAENWYSNAISHNNAAEIDGYYYAEALLHNNKLKEAKIQYQAYYTLVNKPAELSFKLATCDSAAKWLAVKQKPYAVNLEKRLSSVYADWGAVYYGEKSIVLISDRMADFGKNPIDKRTGNSYFTLYSADRDSIALLPVNKDGGKIFNGDYHAGPIAFTAEADTAWITITTAQPSRLLPIDKSGKSNHQRLYTRRLILVMAIKTNGVWGSFKSFAYNNIKEYSVGHAALSKDGATMYFTSDMPGGSGGTDIWYITKKADGSWGKPVNCGGLLNTKGDEAFPTITPDGLSFASNGLPGMGGLDIFVTKGAQGDWSTPVNLRYPVNSTADDFYLATRDGLSGYFSSNRDGGAGNDDIYSFKKENLPPPVKQIQPPVPVPVFNPNKVSAIIYYDLDKSNIRPDASAELDMLVSVLKANPLVKVKLASYTDVRASGSYNIGLSKRRSEAAMAYLVEHGIDSKRITIAWFGEENPVADCPGQPGCPESQQQLNRRTEIIFDGLLR